jgi:hypothetical protein
MIVHNTPEGASTANITPYPLAISRDRVTDENVGF